MVRHIELPLANWHVPIPAEDQQRALNALENGQVISLPNLRFPLQESELRWLSPEVAGQAKNVSLQPSTGVLRGTHDKLGDVTSLRNMLARFASHSQMLLHKLFPSYAATLEQARTSYRPLEVVGRPSSWRKDDTRLHVDSFPSSPTHGKRILRVFTNLHPQGRPRIWRLGGDFEGVAQRFLPHIRPPIAGSHWLMQRLGITKTRRTLYDHYMLQLHDRMKADADYQATTPQGLYEFAPGTTWMVYTDQTPHAAMGGQYALEQTYHLPVQAMQDPARSPLGVLERLLGRPLV